MKVNLLHIGTATVLLDIGGVRLLTDPVFNEAHTHYSWMPFRFPFGANSTKLLGPSVPASEVGAVDAVLVSHDQHDDNLNDAGCNLLGKAAVVLTTRTGARRLRLGKRRRPKLANVRGLRPWN